MHSGLAVRLLLDGRRMGVTLDEQMAGSIADELTRVWYPDLISGGTTEPVIAKPETSGTGRQTASGRHTLVTNNKGGASWLSPLPCITPPSPLTAVTHIWLHRLVAMSHQCVVVAASFSANPALD